MQVDRAFATLALASWLGASFVSGQDVPRPAWVRSGEVNDDGAVVYAAPDEGSPRRGTVAIGTRLSLGKSMQGTGCGDFRFVQVGDEAFMCERLLTASKLEPGGTMQPPLAAGAFLPHEYLFVGAEGIGAYARPSDMEADEFALVLEKDFGIVVRERVVHEGVPLVRSAHGYYARESDLRARPVPTFAGVQVADGQLDAIGWVVRDRAVRKSSPRQKTGEKLARMSLLQIAGPAENGHLALQDGGYVLARDVVQPQPLSAAPSGIGPSERFVDVDTARQVLVVYEGARPIFTTLVSTGVRGAETPEGAFRIWAKLATSDMNDTERFAERRNYSIESVPWVQFFHESIGLHAAFWHDRFGEKHSHGCVNLSPRDARTVFELTLPALPAGYFAGLPTAAAPGTWVIVR